MIQSGILTEQGHSIAFVDAIALGLSGDACIHRIQAFAPDAIVGLAADVSWLEDIRFYRSLSQLKTRTTALPERRCASI